MCSVQHLIKGGGCAWLACRPPCTSGAPPRALRFFLAPGEATPREESATGRHPHRGIKIFHVNWFDSAYGGRVGIANTRLAGH